MEHLLQAAEVLGGDATESAVFIHELDGGPRGIRGIPDHRMVGQPLLLLWRKTDAGAFRCPHTDPSLADLLMVLGGDGAQGLVQNRHQDRPVAANPHAQPLRLEGGDSSDLEIEEVELADSVAQGREVADNGLGLAVGYLVEPLKHRVDVNRDNVRLTGQGELREGIALDEGHVPSRERSEAVDGTVLRSRDDGDGVLDVGLCEEKKTAALMGQRDGRGDVQLLFPEPGKDLFPGETGLDFHGNAEAAADQPDVVGGNARITPCGIDELVRRPGRIHSKPQYRMFTKPCQLLLCERDGLGMIPSVA